MDKEYDVVFIGSGHNGLTCAAYLSKAGLKTVNLERRDVIGGACTTEEITLPGFKHNTHSCYHAFIQMGPVLKDLEVARYHRYVYPDPPMASIFPDGRTICLHVGKDGVERTCKTIEQFSKKDARTYKEIYDLHISAKDLYVAWMYTPPLSPSMQMAPFEGTEAGREMLWMQLSSYRKVAEHYFESDQMRTFMLMVVVQEGVGIEEYGTGQFFPLVITLEHDPGMGLSVGGSNTLAQALGRIVEDNGGKLAVDSEVVRIIVKDGVATGVELKDGTEIRAKKAVVSNIDPEGTFIRMVGEEYLKGDFIEQVKRFAPGISTVTTHFALNNPLQWKVAANNEAAAKAWGILIADNEEVAIDHYRHIKAGTIPQKPEDMAFITVMPTIWDSTQAPSGKHTAFYWLHSAYGLKDGGAEKWDEIKEEVADRADESIRRYAPNMDKNNIIARYVDSPLDLERRMPQLFKGDWLMGDITQDQMGIFRPFHGYPPYHTPIENLYMCGACTHPAGGVTAAPGYNAASVICDDFKIKKWWPPLTVGVKK